LIVGGNSNLLEDVMDTEFLPFGRAVSCDYEYKHPREGENKAIFELLQASQVAEKWARKLANSFT